MLVYGLVTCLLYRAKKICSTKLFFQTEVRSLRQILSKNGYPAPFFNRILKKFLTQSDGVPNQDLNSSREQKRRKHLGKPSKSFFKNAHLLIESKLDIKITLIFKTTKICSYFNIKSRTRSYLKSNVVYKYTCSVVRVM